MASFLYIGDLRENPERALWLNWCAVWSHSLWGTGPECWTVRNGSRSCSECNPVSRCHLWWEQKSHHPDITGSFSQEGRWNWMRQGNRTYTISVRHEWNSSLSSVSNCRESCSCTISHLHLLLPSTTCLAYSLNARACMLGVVLCTVLFKALLCKIKSVCLLCLFFMYYFYESVMNVLWCSTI